MVSKISVERQMRNHLDPRFQGTSGYSLISTKQKLPGLLTAIFKAYY
jgi:hypothetical protein